jgi:ABC-type iron transport system FetAB ATPase subunit
METVIETAAQNIVNGSVKQHVFNYAEYRDQKVKDYRGNPLIEALPDILSAKLATEKLSYYPRSTSSDLILPAELKVHCLDRLKELVYPLPEAISFESIFGTIVRCGYKAHNPMNPETWRHRYTIARNKKAGMPTGHIQSTASCHMVTGYSGMGKSTMAETVLYLYPQLITHRNYEGKAICLCQIVYLKISIPYDGLLSGLCLAFFAAVDKVLGTDFLDQHKELKIDFMLKKMEEIALNYFVGVLVIDELQNLNLAKTGGAKKILSYFRDLMNSVGIPLILIGTYAAIDLFAAGMQDARRATDSGITDVWRPQSKDIHWINFLNAIERYQWIGNGNTKFSESIRKKIYDLSQGITDFAIRLVLLAQRTALEEGKDSLTVNLLERTSERHFRLLLPAIDALRSGKAAKMQSFDDLLSPKTKQIMRENSDNTKTPQAIAPINDGVPKLCDPPLSVPPPTLSTPLETLPIMLEEKKRKTKISAPIEATAENGDIRNIPPGMTTYEAIKAQGLIAKIVEEENPKKTIPSIGRKF